MRKNFEMTQEDLDTLLDSMKPVPMIMLQCGTPPTQQENANNAWKRLGHKMRFDHMSVEPTGSGDRFFSAEEAQTRTFTDGTDGKGNPMHCAVFMDFENLQESPAEFDIDPAKAVAKLKARSGDPS